ncbi:serine hydrolase [Henriciella sp. AS95]|uniref:serine hydrolase domain-containing protein n=1 Tax=Henriciella sp. AS95 TaxID=3135782 RepID=UPI00317D77BE
MTKILASVSAAALFAVACAAGTAQETAPPRPVENAAAGPARSADEQTAAAMSSRSDVSRHDAARGAGYRALHLCSGLFESEMSEELVYATLSRSSRASSDLKDAIDRDARTVSVTYLDDMPPRIAVYRDNLGCTQLPIGASIDASENLIPWPADLPTPQLDSENWPMGDMNATADLPAAKSAALEAVLDDAFLDQEGPFKGDTWGVAIILDSKIVAERYEEGYDKHVSARTNSMCKSLSVSLVGVGVQKGLVDINAKAPLSAWRTPGDPRGEITLNDMLHMASGFWTSGPGNPQLDIYGSGAPPVEISALNMMDAEPGTRFVYSGSDTILSTHAVREAANIGDEWISFPHREFMWKLGMTRTAIETDWKNDFLISGQCWSTVRDFGRFGLLYLNDGMWNGERILPEGWSEYVSTPAPAQPRSTLVGGAGYGAQFWLYGEDQGMPVNGYSAAGALGQYAMIVPDKNLVIVRRGLDNGEGISIAEFTAAVIAALETE